MGWIRMESGHNSQTYRNSPRLPSPRERSEPGEEMNSRCDLSLFCGFCSGFHGPAAGNLRFQPVEWDFIGAAFLQSDHNPTWLHVRGVHGTAFLAFVLAGSDDITETDCHRIAASGTRAGVLYGLRRDYLQVEQMNGAETPVVFEAADSVPGVVRTKLSSVPALSTTFL